MDWITLICERSNSSLLCDFSDTNGGASSCDSGRFDSHADCDDIEDDGTVEQHPITPQLQPHSDADTTCTEELVRTKSGIVTTL